MSELGNLALAQELVRDTAAANLRNRSYSCLLYGTGEAHCDAKDSPFQKHACQEYILVFWTPVSGPPSVTSAMAAGTAPVASVSVSGPGARLPPFTGSWSRASSPPIPRPWSEEDTDCIRLRRRASISDLHTWAHLKHSWVTNIQSTSTHLCQLHPCQHRRHITHRVGISLLGLRLPTKCQWGNSICLGPYI